LGKNSADAAAAINPTATNINSANPLSGAKKQRGGFELYYSKPPRVHSCGVKRDGLKLETVFGYITGRAGDSGKDGSGGQDTPRRWQLHQLLWHHFVVLILILPMLF
jgi:hypothetical protein